MVKGILAYSRRAFCANIKMMAWQSMRNGCAKASFNPFLSTFLYSFSTETGAPCRLGQLDGGGALPRGPAGPGRLPGGWEDAAGVLREEVRRSSIPARSAWRRLGCSLFLYNLRNPRRKDAQEAQELALYRAQVRGRRGAAREARCPSGGNLMSLYNLQ